MQLLKMEVEDLEAVLEDLVVQIFQIFSKISLEILVVVADLEAEKLIIEDQIYDMICLSLLKKPTMVRNKI